MKNKRQSAKGRLLRFLVLIAVLGNLSSVVCLAASYPAWWTNRNVITNMTFTNDYTFVLQGQLKWFATNAYDELTNHYPVGSCTNVLNVITNFTSSNNYFFATVGQLKYVGKPLYDCLTSNGYPRDVPWTDTTTDDCDFALANIGQLKNVFNFDLSGTNVHDTREYYVYKEMPWMNDTNNLTTTIVSRVSITDSRLRVTLLKGQDYDVAAQNTYEQLLQLMNGSYNYLKYGTRDSDAAQVVVWWVDGGVSNGTNNLTFQYQPGWSSTSTMQRTAINVADWWTTNRADDVYYDTSLSVDEVYWQTDIPKGATNLDALVVFTDIIYGAAPNQTDYSDKPGIIGYWHAHYDAQAGSWLWAPIIPYQTNYVVDVPSWTNYLTSPPPGVATGAVAASYSNLIYGITDGHYTIEHRDRTNLNSTDTGYDIVPTGE